jgi:hypothetical protein
MNLSRSVLFIVVVGIAEVGTVYVTTETQRAQIS